MPIKTIYIYFDAGVSRHGLAHTVATLKNFGTTKTINADQVCQGQWVHHADLFVLPGGADLPYVKNLYGQGNTVIKKYIQNGGAFLGICAGAYYASSYVSFDQGGPLEVMGSRQLSLFKGHSVGPVFGPYDYKINRGARAVPIQTLFSDVPMTTVFYNGGGFFKDADRFPHTRVIAYYDRHLPAAINLPYGKGSVLLSAVHFEYDPFLLDARDTHLQKIIPALCCANASRIKLINHIMKILHILP